MKAFSREVYIDGQERSFIHSIPKEGRVKGIDSYQTTWYVIKGEGHLERKGEEIPVREGDRFAFFDKEFAFLNSSESELRLLEIRKNTSLEKANQSDDMPLIIAEVGCNHKGDFDTALEMIKIASQFCKADVVKFQKRTNKELLSEKEYNSPHPHPHNSYGDTYGEHREFLEFDLEQHRVLKQACEYWGVIYCTSVWDITSAKEICSIEPQLIKIPSAINTNFQVMDYLFKNYKGEIHISLGMTKKDEEESIVSLARKSGRLKDIILYHCISGYPVAESELYLLEIQRLEEQYGSFVKGIGFSGHHRGIAADLSALALGARYFERHFTLDRTWKGTDHAASLEPDGLRRLTRDLKEVRQALKKKETDIVAIEEAQRIKLKKIV